MVHCRFQYLVDRAFDGEEAMRKYNIKQEDVELMREKLRSSDLVPKYMDNKQALLFLCCCKGDIDKAVNRMHNYYRIKGSVPEFYTNRDPESADVQKALDNQYYVPLPMTPNDNYLYLHRLSNLDAKNYVYADSLKTNIMCLESLFFRVGPKNGAILILDMQGGGFGHFFQTSLGLTRSGLELIQEACPIEVEAIHILNIASFIDMLINIIKPFISSDLLNKVHFHRADMDMEEFYEKHIPKSHLPSDYGGDLESVEVLHQKHREIFNGMREYFLLEEQQSNLQLEHFANETEEEIQKALTSSDCVSN